MLTCKQVSSALARGDYQKLPTLSRLFLRLHVFGCGVCGRYNRQVILFYDAARNFLAAEEHGSPDAAHGPRLPDAARERLCALLKKTSPPAEST